MTSKDYFGDTLHKKERAEEDLYFAQRDRELAEALHRRQLPDKEKPLDDDDPEST